MFKIGLRKVEENPQAGGSSVLGYKKVTSRGLFGGISNKETGK